MKTFHQIYLISLVLSLGLIACQDHRIVASGKLYRLTSYSQSATRGDINGTVFTYNSSNKLTSYTFRRFNLSQTTTFQYDSQGKLVSSLGPDYYLAFDYTSNGNIGSMRRYSSQPSSATVVPSSISTLDYSTNTFPDRITTLAGSSTTVSSFTYVNGNVTQRTIDVLAPGVAPVNIKVSFQYDSHPNPFYGLVLPVTPVTNYFSLSYTFPTVDTYSRNNAISRSDSPTIMSSTSYNSVGIPVEKYTQVGPTNLISLRELFTYELY